MKPTPMLERMAPSDVMALVIVTESRLVSLRYATNALDRWLGVAVPQATNDFLRGVILTLTSALPGILRT